MIRRLSRRARSSRGTTLVETALSMVPWLLLTFGIIDGGRLLFEYNVVSNAAREGVRWAAVRGQASGRAASRNDIITYVQGLGLGLALNVDPQFVPDNKQGSTVRVTVTRNFAPAVALFTSAGIGLRSSSQMTIAR
jgi:Flp pilus assembly protein TadG